MNFRYSDEVREAREAAAPLVALETSVVAQGLPYPDNLEAARACEEAVRAPGRSPRRSPWWTGRCASGLEEAQMRRLAEGRERLLKLGSRDLAVAVGTRATGGTTVSATCELAAAAGIRVFATGGIGGVHRGVAEHLDVSQDLWALARFPVAVVCAGAKSVLDLPKTLEVLEALGGARGGRGHGRAALASTAAARACRWSTASRRPPRPRASPARASSDWGRAGMLFALPPPEEAALPRAEVELHIAAALRRGRAAGRARQGGDALPAWRARAAHGRQEPAGEPGAAREQRPLRRGAGRRVRGLEVDALGERLGHGEAQARRLLRVAVERVVEEEIATTCFTYPRVSLYGMDSTKRSMGSAPRSRVQRRAALGPAL